MNRSLSEEDAVLKADIFRHTTASLLYRIVMAGRTDTCRASMTTLRGTQQPSLGNEGAQRAMCSDWCVNAEREWYLSQMTAHAAYCLNGHLVGIKASSHSWSVTRRYLEANGKEFPPFCSECGSATIARCPECGDMIAPMALHCSGCGKAFPWPTPTALTVGEMVEQSDPIVPAPQRGFAKRWGEVALNFVKPILQSALTEWVKARLR